MRNILFVTATHSTQDKISGELVDQIIGQLKRSQQKQDTAASRAAVYVVPATQEHAVTDNPGSPMASLQDIEAHHIADLLNTHNGNRRLVASALGISERTLYRKLKKFGVG